MNKSKPYVSVIGASYKVELNGLGKRIRYIIREGVERKCRSCQIIIMGWSYLLLCL